MKNFQLPIVACRTALPLMEVQYAATLTRSYPRQRSKQHPFRILLKGRGTLPL